MNTASIQELIQFRKVLHQHPEVSHQEKQTAQKVKTFFSALSPDETVEKIGGHGLAFIYNGKETGPTTMIRCELDALPIEEEKSIKHHSENKGISHTCGHDGHMAIVAGVGLHLSKNPVQKGRVVLFYQPAEETGEGAVKVIKDPKFKKIKPDFVFALHNLPGHPLHEIVLKKGPFTAASKGMIIQLTGRTSHAAHPEDGNNPAEAMSKIIVGLQALPTSMDQFALITVVHALLGEISFGTTPGKATVRATLRSYDNSVMYSMTDYAERLVKDIAKEYGLKVDISYTESFDSTENDEKAWEYANQAAKNLKLKTKHIRTPFRWSEDLGHFSPHTSTFLFGIGAGKNQPQLHEPNYDFPDKIISTGINMFTDIIQQING